MRFPTRLGLCAAVLVVAGSASGPSFAKTCIATTVVARGEPARLQWLARLKARGNWRGKVRALPELGSAYANWSNADDQVVRCITNTGSIVCTVSARPCRP